MNSLPKPPVYYAIVIEDVCTDVAAQFLIDKLTSVLDENGNKLIISQQKPTETCPHTVLHISAPNELLLKIAEYIEIKKPDTNGYIRIFSVDKKSEFPATGRIGPLSLSDVQRCILYTMERIHFTKTEHEIPGHAKLHVLKGAPIVNSYLEHGLITVYPVHDAEEMDKLYGNWSYSIFSNPIEKIRDYFGENMALFFSFSELYTSFLIIVAAFGITEFLLERLAGVYNIYLQLTFTLMNMVGLGVFLELWKRRSHSHAFLWGTGGKLRHKPPRPEFRGEIGINPATGKEEMIYPMNKTVKKILISSLPVTVVCLICAFILMILSFKADEWMIYMLTDTDTGVLASDVLSQILLFVPTVIYSVLILFLNHKYLQLATHLTELENHRTQEQFETHVVSKLVLFEFVNTFCALFYVAFYLQDLAMLRSQITTMLIVVQIVSQFQESLIPYVFKQPGTVKAMNKVYKKIGMGCKKIERRLKSVPIASEEDTKAVMCDFHSEAYDTTFFDFMEHWLQFGYVFLFMAVYPLAAAFALANNIVEIAVDRYKICLLCRKPRPMAIRDIGAWFTAFRLTAMISIMTNCALLSIDLRKTAGANWSNSEWMLLLFFVEHILFTLMGTIDKVIPDVPAHIKLKMDQTSNFLKVQATTNAKGQPKIYFE